jgi:hypothetical protein
MLSPMVYMLSNYNIQNPQPWDMTNTFEKVTLRHCTAFQSYSNNLSTTETLELVLHILSLVSSYHM